MCDLADCGSDIILNFQGASLTDDRVILSDLLQNINAFGSDIAERDSRINRYKTVAPKNFRGGFFEAGASPAQGVRASGRHIPQSHSETRQDAPQPSKENAFSELLKSATQSAANCDTPEALSQAVQDFTGHPLKKTARNTVFYAGHTKAETLIVGEGPGAEEDKRGSPFVGLSGKLLDAALEAAGFSRHSDIPTASVLITNVLFYRPPGNRKPTAEETALCEPFLRRLITTLAPKRLILLGGAAARVLLPDEKDGIMRLRGRKFFVSAQDGRQIPCFPALHPAYLLRTPVAKKLFWFDLLRAFYGES